jgi:hypothetical protein
MHPFHTIRPKMMFGSVFGAFQKCLACKKMQNLWFGINALLRGTEVAKSVSPQMDPFYRDLPGPHINKGITWNNKLQQG